MDRDWLQRQRPALLPLDFTARSHSRNVRNTGLPTRAVREFDPSTACAVRAQPYRLVVEDFRGSFSTEHGVGPRNADYGDRYISALQKDLAGGTLQLLDPLQLCEAFDFHADSSAATKVPLP